MTKEGRTGRPPKHGGEGALRSIERGVPFPPGTPAAEREILLRAELERDGVTEVLTRGAIRMEVAADLYYAAVCKAAEGDDLAVLDKFIARFGWLQSSAIRSWVLVKAERASQDTGLLAKAIEAADRVLARRTEDE